MVNTFRLKHLLSLIGIVIFAANTIAKPDNTRQNDIKKFLNNGKINAGFLGFINYQYTTQSGNTSNQFKLSRGYLTMKFKPVNWFTARATLDVHQNTDGDWDTRFKYLYAKFLVPVETKIITKPGIEIGLVHVPWFDYEEHINHYRAEGPMFIERAGIMNSADVGFTVTGLLGEKLDKNIQNKLKTAYPGKYGSFALGLYNGGGYHAKENNNNKVFMSRISIRPLGPIFPNLQASYFFIYGRGNTKDPHTIKSSDGKTISVAAPKWITHDIFVSIEHRLFNITGQYAMGRGNQKGDKIDNKGNALKFNGWSVFGEFKIPRIKISVISRYDRYHWDTQARVSRLMAGTAYHFFKHSYVLLSFSREDHKDDPAWKAPKWGIQVSIQAKY